MRIYFVDTAFDSRTVDLNNSNVQLNCLLSYYYINNRLKKFFNVSLKNDAKFVKDILIDSGGFSAFTQGVKIDLIEYSEFIKANQIEKFFNLDVIGDAEKTIENQRKLESLDINPIPVFHFGEDLKYLELYLNEYDYIGIGGLVPYNNRGGIQDLFIFLDKVFSVYNNIGNKNRLHAFGVLNPTILYRFPFYSCDSTSWLVGYKFKRIIHFNPFFKYGLKLDTSLDLKTDEEFFNLGIQNILSCLKFEKYITNLWKERGIVYE